MWGTYKGSGTSLRNHPGTNAPWQLEKGDLISALARLNKQELVVALRWQIFPVSWERGRIGFAACGTIATQQARNAGLRIVARAPLQTTIEALEEREGQAIADQATHGLRRNRPGASASRRLTFAQGFIALAMIALLSTGFVLAPGKTGAGVTFLLSLIFFSVIALKAVSLLPLPRKPAPEPAALGDFNLPVYTVLVPLYGETAVLHELIGALNRLDYPWDKLDIKLILEQSDVQMRRAVAKLHLPDHYQVLTVPEGLPRTKPKALNYALVFARGDLVTVYDAEDEPMPDQLRRAAAVFAAAPASFACLQARLAYYNSDENWLTRPFALDYAAVFDLLLPMFAASGLPLPLGGTSNHIRMSALRHIGGWDAFNVTEDADLGLRLARAGYGCGVMRSTTYEEANCRMGNWLWQRARWFKGWMQTWLVHMRAPRQLWRELGAAGFIAAQIMMAGMMLTALLHPIFLLWVLWVAFTGADLPQVPRTTTIVIAGGTVLLIVGYVVGMWTAARAIIIRGQSRLAWSVVGIPLYWCLISLGGWLALWQFIVQPFYWNKTAHGLSRQARPPDP